MIQREHPEIQAAAAQIRQGARSVQELAAGTLQFMASNAREALPPGVELQNDALSFLRSGFGECVAYSNLFAALMRANGVPTRIVTGISRSGRDPQYMHYQNEYFVPGKGWVHVEPQGLDIQSSRAEIVHTGVVYPAQEAEGFGFEGYAGVPQLTMKPEEVDDDGRRVPGDDVVLWAAPGLEAREPTHPYGPGLHAAL